MSRPDIAERSKGLPGGPAGPGLGPKVAVALCSAGESLDEVSSLDVLLSSVPALSSKKISTCEKLTHFKDSRNYSSYSNC